MNKVVLAGYVTVGPDEMHDSMGSSYCGVTMVTREKRIDFASKAQYVSEDTHRVVFFGKIGRFALNVLFRGAALCVEGKVYTIRGEDSNGKPFYSSRINASQLEVFGESGGRPRPPEKKAKSLVGGGEVQPENNANRSYKDLIY